MARKKVNLEFSLYESGVLRAEERGQSANSESEILPTRFGVLSWTFFWHLRFLDL